MELLDRNYYRMCEDSRLLEDAKYKPNAELAIVLAERQVDVVIEMEADIYEAKERANDFEIDCNQLDDKVYQLQAEIQKLELMLGERDRIIEELKKGN